MHRKALTLQKIKDQDMTAQELAQAIWNVKEIIRLHYDDSEVEDVILPFTLLRRLDCVFEPHREEIFSQIKDLPEGARKIRLKVLLKNAGINFYNTSNLTLDKLRTNPNSIADNFKLYLNGFSDNVKDILGNFVKADPNSQDLDLSPIYERLDRLDKLYAVTQEFCKLDLSLDAVDNAMMGTVFEIVIRYSKESTNTMAGQFYTPRDIVRLLVSLTFSGREEELYKPGKMFSIYDPCCGTGGMLTVGKEYMIQKSGNPNLKVFLYGQELNQKTYAICKADLLLKGDMQELDEQLFQGDTLANDKLKTKKFNFMITNPPFGVDWKSIADKVEAETGPGQRFEAGLPDKSDGSLLFLEHLVSKMEPESGSRIGIVLNGSPLFNGDAGSGWSNIRKMLLDRNLLDCIIRLPSSIFYGTSIGTYFWILDNQRPAAKYRKLLMIDADHNNFKELLPRNLGVKRYNISDAGAADILSIYEGYQNATRMIQDDDDAEPVERTVAKLMDYDDFLYTKVEVDRPLRLVFRNVTGKYTQLLQDSKFDANKKANQILMVVSELPDIDVERTDREFFTYLAENKISVKAADVKLLRNKFGETNEEAPEVYTKPLKPSSGVEADTSLRDYERIPMKQDIDVYFEENVKKFVPDAWMERDNDKVGCELPFNRLFYVYKPLRSTEEILRDLKELDKNSENDLATLLKEEEA